ncbi:MAG: OmpH family outer membrane protein [Paramuribaculum sp.]|nr:OmpH family outer membrane protein [Bacteroides sp.]MDE6052051.1 OmpH family outer membrane protein [Paramuribaculum sp.]
MKKNSYFVAPLLMLAMASSMIACGGNETPAAKKAAEPKKDAAVPAKKGEAKLDTTAAPVAGQINVRYLDEERLLTEYSLAKDFQESITRLQSKLMSAQESRAKEIQQLGMQIESKMKNNKYTSEAEYNSDMAAYNKKQVDAQNYLANLQRTTEAEVAQLQAQLQDSIRGFVKEYSINNGYDAVLMGSAAVFFNPAFDVTDEVVKGLNARYNKVEK